LLDRFVARLPERVAEMQRLVRAADVENLGRALHQLKGAAGGYGFPELTLAARRAEESIKQCDDLAVVASQVDELVELIRRVEGFQSSPGSEPPPGAAPAPRSMPVASEPRIGRLRIDVATGLPGRTHLLERLSAEIAMARRKATPLCCIALQIEPAQTIAGSFDAPTLDALAKRAGEVLALGCQGDSYLCRADVLSFAVIVPGSPAASAEEFASRLTGLLPTGRFDDIVGELRLSCRAGVAQLDLTTLCAADLLAAAQEMLDGASAPAK
jgi:GGDEF domain-containing protein